MHSWDLCGLGETHQTWDDQEPSGSWRKALDRTQQAALEMSAWEPAMVILSWKSPYKMPHGTCYEMHRSQYQGQGAQPACRTQAPYGWHPPGSHATATNTTKTSTAQCAPPLPGTRSGDPVGQADPAWLHSC